jgi:hypothetical protein
MYDEDEEMQGRDFSPLDKMIDNIDEFEKIYQILTPQVSAMRQTIMGIQIQIILSGHFNQGELHIKPQRLHFPL